MSDTNPPKEEPRGESSPELKLAGSPTQPDFIRERIADELARGMHSTGIVTRFPPEPNGYLHIGHAKAICLNFGLAQQFGGRCHLRMDDTNPAKEEQEYIDAIVADVRWLGFEWGRHMYYASDYFERLYQFAEELVRRGKAYVDDLTADQIREHRGTLTQAGKNSPYRDRSVEENLDLLRRMRAGEFPDGAKLLRAKIDMGSPNINMRDPALYRIRRHTHPRTGDSWCLYPMYDYAHPLSDMLEGITHSICTLEFEDHRPLYDWCIESIEAPCHPRQIEFARLNLTYTVMSKRRLLQLVQEKHVSGWDDPRMPTLSGLRRRGYQPEAIRAFCERIGVAKRDSIVDVALLEFAVREDLNRRAPRVMGVVRPLKIVLTNYPGDREEQFEAVNNPEDPSAGTRMLPFSREIWIERDDFMEDPPKKFFRLRPGGEVRLRCAYIIKCAQVIKNEAGEIVELHCTVDHDSRGGNAPDGRRIQGTLHWVSARHAIDAELRLYDRLFSVENPGAEEDYLTVINPNSLEVVDRAKLERSVIGKSPGWFCQFERIGYFCLDADSTAERPVFNRTVGLKDSWAKIAK